jgi:hypothetical protein
MVRITIRLILALAIVLGAFDAATVYARRATFYIDSGNVNCSNSGSGGSQSVPYCTVAYAAGIANAGDVFNVLGANSNLKHAGGPVTFTRPGTSTNPITWQAVGEVTLFGGVDVVDSTFTPAAGLPGVYQVPWTLTGARCWQRYFDDIIVDDPNQSMFTLKDSDGALQMTTVTSEADLVAHDGTCLRDTVNLRLLVHPYSDRVPSNSQTDISVGNGNSITLDVKANWQIFRGFTISSTGGSSGLILSSNNKFYDMHYVGNPLNVFGDNNYFENITINHGIWRQGPAWDWDLEGEGATGGFSSGSTGNTMVNLHVFNSWNSTFNSEGANGNILDGGRFHGAPNHCTGTGNGNNTVRNAVWWNCQDYQWLFDPTGITMEHVVIPGGLAISAVEGFVGPITIRNSIFTGVVHFVRGTGPAGSLPLEGCAWETGSLMEYNVIGPNATIERCDTQIAWPIDTYVAKCASGEFTNCMTIRNNIVTQDFLAVIGEGIWNSTKGEDYDYTLVTGSPALNAGMVSGTLFDILRVSRPQGTAPDIGVYESECTCPAPSPSARLQNKRTRGGRLSVQRAITKVQQLAGLRKHCPEDITH